MPQECAVQLRLVQEYSRAVTDFSVELEVLKHAPHEHRAADWMAVEAARAESQTAWEALEMHIAEHRCVGLSADGSDGSGPDSGKRGDSDDVLGRAAEAALDVILVVDDNRRYVAANDAALRVLGLPRDEILGRSIDELFLLDEGASIPLAWEYFISKGTQMGICKTNVPGYPRRFEYRAKANFIPGLHLSVLREIEPD